MKKIVLGIGLLSAALVGASTFAAWEAHVINVTAQIENAIAASVEEIEFGTLFPQEHLDKPLQIRLSDSFIGESRVDDISYKIRQKPKCRNSQTGEFGRVTETDEGEFVCEDEGFEVLPLLCPYLSKEDDKTPDNDGSIVSFHGPISGWGLSDTIETQVDGKLAKSEQDIEDTWKIDVAVPCFMGHCAQDWEKFVEGINPEADPDEYIQPAENEHKLFGCDLWVEVFGISLPGLGCEEELDLMLVLDRSGSINDTELQTLKDAANAFITTLAPSVDGVHTGQTSFATIGSLDLHLTSDETAAHAAINALDSTGLTNLFEGIDLATDELDDAHEHERAAIKDIMVIITDGNPNEPGSEDNARTVAAAAADAARAAGIEIFVVGVGSDVDDDYLRDEIADDASHYFDAADFDALNGILQDLVSCEE